MILFSSKTELKVPFFDIDPMGIVWHGNYVKYMEIARCDMFSKLGYTYLDMKNDGYIYPVAKMDTKFISPLIFEQEIIMLTELVEIEPAIIIKYTFFDKVSDSKVFSANTMQIAYNPVKKESIYIAPAALKEKIRVLSK